MANKYLDDVGLTHLWTKIKDYVSANSNKYTLPVATTSILGGVKLGSDTIQTVAAVAVQSTANRTYAIQKNNNGQLVVNVPWSNSNTTLSGLARCTTAAATAAKTATMPGFALSSGQYILLRTTVTNSATSNVTLSVNSTTAKPVKIGNSSTAPTASNFPAGDYLANYDGTNWVLTRIYLTDTKYNNATTTAAGLMSADDKIKLNDTGITPTLESQTIALGLIYSIMDNVPSPTAANSAERTFFNNLFSYISSNRSVNGIYVRFEAYSTFLKLDFADVQTGLLQFSIMENIDSQANGYGVVYTAADNLITFSKHSSNAVATTSADGLMSSTDKTKLNSIASGAEVNVQSDWNVTNTSSDAFIKNKPSLATVATSGSYNDLSNKPTIPTVNNGTLTLNVGGQAVSGNNAFTANDATNTTYNVPSATASTYGVVKVSSVNSSAVTVNSESTTAGRYYPVELNSDGKAIVNVPWTDTDTNTHYTTGLYVGATNTKSNAATSNGETYLKLYDDSTKRVEFKLQGSGATTVASDASGNITITSQNSYQVPSYTTGLQISSASTSALTNLYVPVATSTQYGVVKIGYTQSGKNYPVQLSSGQMYVNVPWTDNNTTNTTGATDISTKIYLVGASSQAANPQTYSDDEVYTTNGVLTTKKTQVGGGEVTMEYDSTYKALKFVF